MTNHQRPPAETGRTEHSRARLADTFARLLDPNNTTAATPHPPAAAPARQGWPGLYLGAGRYGPVTAGPEHHALILGPPRSGKTTRLAVPNLLAHPGAAVVTSTKTDIAAATWPTRRQRGQGWLWDPTGTLNPPDDIHPLRWSPVVGCQSWDNAVRRAHTLATAARPAGPTHLGQSDIHWIERAQALLAPLLHAAAIADAELAVVAAWLHRRELLQPLSLLHEQGNPIAANILQGVAHTDPREQSGIFSTADGLLAAYRAEAALATTQNPNFEPDAFAASTDTIYIVAPTTTQTLHAPLVVALLDQIRTATYQQPPNPPVLLAVDELANIAPLPDLPTTLAEGASQGIVILACLQDLSQARQRWGTAADGFLTLFTHKIILPGIADTTTLKQISTLAGDIDITYRSTGRPVHRIARTDPTYNLAVQRRPRLPPDTIAAGQAGTALWLNRTTPRHVQLPPWQ